jgi:hypothetical protein
LFILGGEVAKLGKIDGINQWPSLMQDNNDVPRNGTLLNVGDFDDMEAIIEGNFKLIRSTLKRGVYDGFYGEDGRGAPNPPYDNTRVITSPVYKAINALYVNTSTKEHQLNDKIKQMRTEAAVNCDGSKRIYIGGPYCSSFCLFDLDKDPCETNNLVSKYPEVAEALKKKLEQFRSEMVPELTRPTDPASNPSFFNNTWVCWLDDENVKKVPQNNVSGTANCIVVGSSANLSVPVYIFILSIVFICLCERFLNAFNRI